MYIELPQGCQPLDTDIAAMRLEEMPVESRPYGLGDHDKDGIAELMA